MEFNDLKELLLFLTNIQKNNDFGKDSLKLKYLCTELQKIPTSLPTTKKLNELKKIEVDLEVKYDELTELGTYFDPLYIKIKKKIHEEDVKKLREKNKIKKGKN